MTSGEQPWWSNKKIVTLLYVACKTQVLSAMYVSLEEEVWSQDLMAMVSDSGRAKEEEKKKAACCLYDPGHLTQVSNVSYVSLKDEIWAQVLMTNSGELWGVKKRDEKVYRMYPVKSRSSNLGFRCVIQLT